MPNGQQVPPPQQQASLVTHDIAPGREIGYFTGTGQRGGTTTSGGTFYSISGQSEDMLFRTPAEAQQYATSKGTPITSQVGVSDVPSSQYWQQRQAEEARREAAYGGVRTAAALGEVGKPVAGSQLEAKVKFLERGTAQFASESQFTRTAEEVGRTTPVSAKGVIVTPGFRTGEEQLRAMEPTITPPETQKITLPPTPRETTEAFMKRMEGEGRIPIKAPYGTDIFGYPRQAPGRIIYPGQEESIPMKIFSGAKTISSVGLGMGFGEAFTTSSMLRGAKLIQPGDVAAITKSIKSFAPKIPSGLKEFIGAEEAVLPRQRTVQVSQSVSRQYTPTSQIEAVGVVGGKLITREVRGTVVEISEPEIETSAIVSGDIAHAQAQYVKAMEKGRIELARLQQVYGAVEVPKTVQVTQQAQRAISTTRQASLEQQIQKSLLSPVSVYKLFSIQQPEAITRQITKQRTVLTPVEIGMTRQIQRTFQISPQVPVSRTVTPQIERAVSVTPQISVTQPVMEPLTIPKEISRGFEPPRLKEPEITKPIALPFPDFQVYPTRKKGKKKAKGERILKLYPVGQAENILSSLGMGTKKISKRKHKKK